MHTLRCSRIGNELYAVPAALPEMFKNALHGAPSRMSRIPR